MYKYKVVKEENLRRKVLHVCDSLEDAIRHLRERVRTAMDEGDESSLYGIQLA